MKQTRLGVSKQMVGMHTHNWKALKQQPQQYCIKLHASSSTHTPCHVRPAMYTDNRPCPEQAEDKNTTKDLKYQDKIKIGLDWGLDNLN